MVVADTEKMHNNKDKPSGVAWQIILTGIRRYAYIEQINSGKMTVTEAVNELGGGPDQQFTHG